MGYIYLIQNSLNSKCYVGQTTELDIYTRWKSHLKNNSNCRYLKNALNKCGKDAFKFQIICVCFDEDLNRFEEEYMKAFNCSVPNGYNLRAAGNHGKHHEDTKAKISASHKGKKPINNIAGINKKTVVQFDLKMNIVNKFESGTQACKHINVHNCMMSRACLAQRGTHLLNGFIWKYENNIDI